MIRQSDIDDIIDGIQIVETATGCIALASINGVTVASAALPRAQCRGDYHDQLRFRIYEKLTDMEAYHQVRLAAIDDFK